MSRNTKATNSHTPSKTFDILKLPIVIFARSIKKKPTSEFTQLDMLDYYKWLGNKKWKPEEPKRLVSSKAKDGKILLTWG